MTPAWQGMSEISKARMSASPSALFSAVRLEQTGRVAWRDPVPSRKPGIYIVSLHADPGNGSGLEEAPLDYEALDRWLKDYPGLKVHKRSVTVEELAKHLARWWLPSTSVLYIGKAEEESLRKRVRQYYTTPLGAKRPHGGGYWLKTIMGLEHLSVHYAETPGDRSPGECENSLLNTFLGEFGCSRSSPRNHHAPFAQEVVAGATNNCQEDCSTDGGQ